MTCFTNQMELTPNGAREILKILEEQQHGSY